jgi:hypothetical protein
VLRAAAAELRVASLPDPHSAWEEAQWLPWPESSARSSHNSASLPGDNINAHEDEAKWTRWRTGGHLVHLIKP